jgi:hypothetical protein
MIIQNCKCKSQEKPGVVINVDCPLKDLKVKPVKY